MNELTEYEPYEEIKNSFVERFPYLLWDNIEPLYKYYRTPTHTNRTTHTAIYEEFKNKPNIDFIDIESQRIYSWNFLTKQWHKNSKKREKEIIKLYIN